MKILYLTNIPSPYTVSFLNELGKNADVIAVFERDGSAERDSSWYKYSSINFTSIVLHGIDYGVDKAICFNIIGTLKKYKDRKIIVSNPTTITGMMAIYWLKSHQISYALQVEGGVHKDGKGLTEYIKKKVFSDATHYFSSGKLTDEYLIFYGAESQRISHYPFTSVYSKDIGNRLLTSKEKQLLRKKLKIEGNFIVLAVGQYIYRKGFDVLIKALSECKESISAYIIGGKPTDQYIELCQNLKIDNIHFIGFQVKDTILEWMKASDVFVMPTRYDIWGLVVNEAMSQGLPVVSSDACVAGREMIDDWNNGVLFKSEDDISLADILDKLNANRELLTGMGTNCLKKAEKYTYERMAEAHLIDW